MEQKAKVESLLVALEEIPILQFDKLVMGDSKNFQLSKSNLDELQVKHIIKMIVKLIFI